MGRDFFEDAQIRVGDRIVRPAEGTMTRRGRPPLGKRAKVQQSLRLSPDVIEHFRATGPGWHGRINDLLERHVAEAGRRAGGGAARVAEERSGYRAKGAEAGRKQAK